jgi:hypothetical protein
MQAFAAKLVMACAALAATLGACITPARGGDAAGLQPANVPALFRFELDDGTTITGALQRITANELSIVAEGSARTLPLSSVRRVERAPSGRSPAQQGRAWLTMTDGTTLVGDDFSWAGGLGLLLRADGQVELPMDRVRTIDWRSPNPEAANNPAAAGGPGEWLASIPETTESDLVVIRKGNAFEFVECAIAAVSADAVSVVLDEEKIPVKRSKVVGLHWLRAAGPKESARFVIDLTAGRLRADTVEWNPEGLVLDGAVKLSAAMLERIDFAAGRTVALATLTPERLDVEPYFGGLAKIEGLAGFFAPRAVPADAEFPRPGLVIRPRTVAVWRLPANSRRFRTVIEPAGRVGGEPAVVVVAIDDREAFRRQIDASAAVPIDLDLSGARRLSLSVDFAPAGGSGAVRLTEPVIEK